MKNHHRNHEEEGKWPSRDLSYWKAMHYSAFLSSPKGQMWSFTPVNPTLGRLRQEDWLWVWSQVEKSEEEKKQVLGCWNGAEVKGTWWPEFDAQDPHGGEGKTDSHKLLYDLNMHTMACVRVCACAHAHTFTHTCMDTHISSNVNKLVSTKLLTFYLHQYSLINTVTGSVKIKRWRSFL